MILYPSTLESSQRIENIFENWELALPGIFEARLEAAGSLAERACKAGSVLELSSISVSILECFVHGKLHLDKFKKENQVVFCFNRIERNGVLFRCFLGKDGT